MSEFISYIFVNAASAIYLSWTITYFFCPLFSVRWKVKCPKAFISLILVPLMTIFQILRPDFMLNTENFMFQFAGFVICLVLFEGKLIKLVDYYLFYLIIEYTVELLAVNIFVQIHNRIPDAVQYSVHQIQIASTPWEYFCILLMNILFGILFFRKSVKVMNLCFPYLHAKTTFQILLPLLMPAVIYGFLCMDGVRLSFVEKGILYWTVCISTFYFFPQGIQKMRKRQLKYVRDQAEIQMIRKQMEASDKMQTEYSLLRKWNHDVQNHLIALTYLMDMRRYPEALRYSETLLTRIHPDTVISEKEGFHET